VTFVAVAVQELAPPIGNPNFRRVSFKSSQIGSRKEGWMDDLAEILIMFKEIESNP
jgi:hypothetical protein